MSVLDVSGLDMNLMAWIGGALENPSRQFNAIMAATWKDRYLAWAAGWVAFISALQPLTHPQGVVETVFWVLVGCVGGLLSWLLLAGLIKAVAIIFSAPGSFRKLLVLSALALTPWITVPPLTLLQHSAVPGLSMVAALLQLGLWLWCLALLCLAVSTSFQLAWYRVALGFLVIPAIGWLTLAVMVNLVSHLVNVVS